MTPLDAIYELPLVGTIVAALVVATVLILRRGRR